MQRPSRWFRSLLVVALLGSSAVDCVGSVPPEPATSRAVVLTEPWSSLGLPIDGGVIASSDASALTVTYAGASAADLAVAYATAIQAAGFAAPSTGRGHVASVYQDGRATLTLDVGEGPDLVTVHLTKR